MYTREELVAAIDLCRIVVGAASAASAACGIKWNAARRALRQKYSDTGPLLSAALRAKKHLATLERKRDADRIGSIECERPRNFTFPDGKRHPCGHCRRCAAYEKRELTFWHGIAAARMLRDACYALLDWLDNGRTSDWRNAIHNAHGALQYARIFRGHPLERLRALEAVDVTLLEGSAPLPVYTPKSKA